VDPKIGQLPLRPRPRLRLRLRLRERIWR